MKNPSQGYVYIVKGEKFIKEAENSARSLKGADHNAHITVISDIDFESDVIDTVEIREPSFKSDKWRQSLLYKVENLSMFPYDRTFYVDADTYFVEDCSELFSLLEYYDICMAHSPNDDEVPVIEGERLEGYYPYNTGVFLYRNSKANRRLFSRWRNIFADNIDTYTTDQVALMEALLTSESKVYVLQNIYNARTPLYLGLMKKHVKVVHGRHKDMMSVVNVINEAAENRAWDPSSKKVLYQKGMNIVGGKN